jgi:hypothetical protein
MSEPKCRCNCGYTCGGPGRCQEPSFQTCLNEHFVVDCDHTWDGPTIKTNVMGCEGESVTCSTCGEVQVFHDIRNGP